MRAIIRLELDPDEFLLLFHAYTMLGAVVGGDKPLGKQALSFAKYKMVVLGQEKISKLSEKMVSLAETIPHL